MKRKTKEAKSKGTKEEKFNFDDEIIIGLKRIDEKTNVNKKSNNKKQSSANTKKKQENKKKMKKPVEKKLTPKQELSRKKRKVIFRLVKWTTLLCIIIGGIIYMLLSPIFNIEKINIVGNSKISTEEIISLSNVDLHQNMFKYRKSDIINKIKENAYIDKVVVKRKLPDAIEITVTERVASFKIKIANAYAFINNQGYILEITDKKQDLPIISGIETIQENIQTGNRLCNEDLKKIGDVLKIMESATSNGLSQDITKIDITNDDNYILILKEKKKTVYLGDISNLSTKMLWILKLNELEGNTEGDIILNMNLNDENSKPYFREKI